MEPAAGLVIPRTLGVLSINIFEATGGLVRDGALSDLTPSAGNPSDSGAGDTTGTYGTGGITATLDPVAPTASIIQNVHQSLSTTTTTTVTTKTTDSVTTSTEKKGLGGGVGGGRTLSGGIGQGVGGGRNLTEGVGGGAGGGKNVGGGNGKNK